MTARPAAAAEADAHKILTLREVQAIEQRATFNRPVSRVEIRQLCATVRHLDGLDNRQELA